MSRPPPLWLCDLDFGVCDQAFPANRLLAPATLDRCATALAAWCWTARHTARQKPPLVLRPALSRSCTANNPILPTLRRCSSAMPRWPVYNASAPSLARPEVRTGAALARLGRGPRFRFTTVRTLRSFSAVGPVSLQFPSPLVGTRDGKFHADAPHCPQYSSQSMQCSA